MNERELITHCLNNDKAAWNIFLQRYGKLVYWAVRRRLAFCGFRVEEAEIEDIFQEVFVVVLQGGGLRRLKNPSFLPGWLAMVASNKTSDYLRQKLRREQKIVLDVPLSDDTAEQTVLGNDIMAVIREVIAGLADRERIVLSLNLLEQKSHKQIAQMLGVPRNTVSTIIARTKQRLKKELQKRGIRKNL